MNGEDLTELIQTLLPDLAPGVQSVTVPLSERTRQIHITLPNGTRSTYLLKRAAATEYHLYSTYLTPDSTGAPALLGAVAAPRSEEHYLLLQWLQGSHPDFTDTEQVIAVYRRLGDIHRQFLGLGPEVVAGGPWPVRREVIDAVLSQHPSSARVAGRAADQLAALPFTLVHGDFHRWNLIHDGTLLRLLDWEHGASAHPVWDLVLLAPDEPGWEGVPCGNMAELALEVYHESGPLTYLPNQQFRVLHTLARLFVSARRLRQHEDWLRTLQDEGAVMLVDAYRQDERRRLDRLLDAL